MFQRFFGRSERPDKGAGALPARLTFDGFLRTSPGRLLLEWEAEAYDELTVDVFGSCALQIGMPELNTLAENRMQSKWLIELQSTVSVSADVLSGDLGCIVAAPELLPIADESMDLVTLPHVLELSPNPQQALHEAVRVLEPEGRLILTAFNGAGFWWMRQQTVRLGAKPYLPTDMAPIPLRRLKDWFALLGLEIDRGRFGLYRPGFRSARRLHTWEWLDKAGDRWLPQCSNILLLSAVKRRPGARIVNCSEFANIPAKVPTSGVPAAGRVSSTFSQTSITPSAPIAENHKAP